MIHTPGGRAAGSAARRNGRRYVTQNSAMQFIGTVTGGTVRAEARVIHRGRSTSLIHVDIRDAEGVILATGDFSYFCVDQKVGENPDIKEWKK